ncbi:MAG: NAD(P)H-dependent oxidoreductase [Rhodococcus sp.]|nr:NAD(P)H-dependent oxidoreductase [Rhodococcus sp. (in: high G+C Gram-positive bacteria)]
MNVLWVNAHPEPLSLTHQLAADGIAALEATGHEVRRSDLYRMGWNPVVTGDDFGHDPHDRLLVGKRSRRALEDGTLAPDIREEQRKIDWADGLVVQFPLWWFGMPAILKGWFDRILVEGYGYGVRRNTGETGQGVGSTRRYGDGLLAGKRATIVVSFGGSAHTVGPRGINGRMDELLFPIQHGIFWYTGMSVVEPFLVDSADRLTPDGYHDVAARLSEHVRDLFDCDPIAFYSQDTDYDENFVLLRDRSPGATGVRAHSH